MSVARLILVTLAVLAVLSVLIVLAFTSALADPSSGSGERFPGRTATTPHP